MPINKNNTMTTREANHLTKLKEEANAALDKLDEYATKMLSKYGESAHCYDNDGDDKETKPFMRITIKDNIKKLMEEGAAFKVTSVKAYDIKIETLKNKPKEME